MTNLGYKQLSVLQEVQENQIKLNIGGKIFLTSKVTLRAEPNSLFGMLFRKSCPMRPINGDTYNFDRNPRYFEFLLDYFRIIPTPWEVTLSKLLSIVSDFEREEHLKYKLA